MAKRFSFFFILLILVMGTVVFSGCDSTVNGDAALLEGTWVSGKEMYIITAKKFTSMWDGALGYEGTIENTRSDGSGAGYITIKYTTAYDPANVGNYYVIHYKGLSSGTIELAGAANATDFGDGKATLAEAEAEYTVIKGYFGMYSALTRQ